MKDFRTLLIIILSILFLVSLTAVGYLFFQLDSQPPQITLPPLPTPSTPIKSRETELKQTGINVFYLTKDYTQLESERRTIFKPDSITNLVLAALKELVRRPVSSNLINPIPKNTKIENVFWSEEEGRIYVSFSEELLDNKSEHALSEWAIIYSIVNTAADQSPRIKDVQILINGEIIQSENTVWDWSLPFAPDKTFVRYNISTDFIE